MTLCTRTCKIVSLAATVISLFVLGICLVSLCQNVYRYVLRKEITITDHSVGYELWKETPIPMYLNIYLFNWTNAEEVTRNWTIKPIFEERGPYVFLEHHSRVNLTWNECENTVTYYQRRVWHFLPELSNGTLQDNITNLNVIAATAGYLVSRRNIFVKKMADFYIEMKEKQLIQTKTVAEWTFDGYDDELLEMLAKLNTSIINIPYSKFGWFYGRNNSDSYDGNFTMYTGVNDMQLLGIINKWNGASWTGDYSSYCGVVNGTSGELWPPVKQYEKVAIFTSDLCSSLWLFNETDTEETLGLMGRKYVGTDYVFDNGTKYPEQKCFNNYKTYPSGIRDVSACKFGAPAFVSYPHFYLADPYYRNAVIGMKPNKSAHEFFVNLEPNTGIPLEARAGLQLNILIEPIEGLKMFENVKTTFVPMLYFIQEAKLSDKLASKAKFLLTLPTILTYTGSGLIGLGVLLIGVALYLTYKRQWGLAREEESLLSDDT